MNFDLVDEPWLPVLRKGQRELISLREGLREAADLDDLAPPRPTHVPAVLRQVLLPVLIHALGIPDSDDEWASRWARGCFDRDKIDAYLDRHHDRFDLFHPERPFAQVGGLVTAKGEMKPSSLLIPSISSGNNVPLFSARTETEPPALTPAQAALWLLHIQCWDTAAIKTGAVGDAEAKSGKTTGNPTGPLGQFEVVTPVGRTLFETLMLNTPVLEDGLPREDTPQWRGERHGPSWAERPPRGLLDLFTWQARRVRLIPTEGMHGPVVREVIVCAGDRLVADSDLEPHATWIRESKPRAGQPARRPRRPRAGRNAWQGLDALLALDPPPDGTTEASGLTKQVGRLQGVLGEDYPLRVLTTGVLYGNQSAVVDHVVTDELPLPVAALRHEASVRETLTEVVEQTQSLANALNGLDATLRRARGGDPVPWNRGQRPDMELVQLLDPQVRRLLTGLQVEPRRQEEAELAWQQQAYRIVHGLADRLLDAVPSSAFAGRHDPQRNQTYRPANAERAFRARVAGALPRLFDDTDRKEEAS